MADRPSFWTELKERRVVRVAVVYIAVGWAVIEGSQTLTDILSLPGVTSRIVFALVVLGFPVAVALAWAFQMTPSGLQRAEAYGGRASRLPFLAGLAVGVLSVSGVAFYFFGQDDAPPSDGELDENAVAVLPFRVSAPGDLSYMAGGVMELISAKLDGEVGPRSVDPGLVARVEARDTSGALSVARAVGAGQVLTGSAVAEGSSLTYNAELARTEDGEILAQATTVAHADSLTSAVDQLVGQLLSLSAGEYRESVATLTSQSPEALKAYLRGREAWRAGEYAEAADHFDEAIRVDSTFALAGLARADAGNMATGRGSGGGLELAASHRDRLSARDQMYLDARSPQQPRTRAEGLEAYRRLTQVMPDRLEAWYWLGELQTHTRFNLSDDWIERAKAPFLRVLELDPDYFPALEHLMFLETLDGTPESIQALATRYLALKDVYVLYRGLAEGTGLLTLDPAIARSASPSLVEFQPSFAYAFTTATPDDYLPFVDAALAYSRERAGIDVALPRVLLMEYRVNQALGRRAAARRALAEREGGEFTHTAIVTGALWADVELGPVAPAVAAIEEAWAAVDPASATTANVQEITRAQAFRFVNDPSHVDDGVAEAIRSAAAAADHPEDLVREAHALLLELWSQARTDDPRATTTFERLDGVIRQGPSAATRGRTFLLMLASALEEAGDYARALEILDRRSIFTSDGLPYEVDIWRRQGRLAALAGDTERAITEYENYVKLRRHADPDLQPEVEAVRAELERLRGS